LVEHITLARSLRRAQHLISACMAAAGLSVNLI
jgi:hypothetical protein